MPVGNHRSRIIQHPSQHDRRSREVDKKTLEIFFIIQAQFIGTKHLYIYILSIQSSEIYNRILNQITLVILLETMVI